MSQTDFFSFPVYSLHEDTELIAQPQEFKDLVVLIDKEELNPESESQLLKIIQSVGRNRNTTSFFHLHGDQGIDIRTLLKRDENSLLISFGIHGSRLGVQIEESKYTLLKMGELSLLFVDSLTSLQQDVNKKRQLWSSLKQYFDL